jgi:hypothetical protein
LLTGVAVNIIAAIYSQKGDLIKKFTPTIQMFVKNRFPEMFFFSTFCLFHFSGSFFKTLLHGQLDFGAFLCFIFSVATLIRIPCIVLCIVQRDQLVKQRNSSLRLNFYFQGNKARDR